MGLSKQYSTKILKIKKKLKKIETWAMIFCPIGTESLS